MATEKLNVQVIPYLTYEGNCEEALNFYQSIFGGEVRIENRYDNPAIKAPESYKDKILHARFLMDGGAIYASDAFPGTSTAKSSGDVSISVMLTNADKALKAFTALAKGGEVHFPFEKQFWGAYHGSLTDKYGFKWNLNAA